MRCSKCGADNRDTARFCDGCGVPIQTQCSSCGTLGRPGAKFCDGCGGALPSPPPAAATTNAASAAGIQFNSEAAAPESLEGERKTVTALFADIKGSMELIEDLDPEEARRLVDPALKLMMDAVHRFEAMWRNRPGMASSRCSALRSRMKIIRNEHCTPPAGCRRTSSVTPTSCASRDS